LIASSKLYIHLKSIHDLKKNLKVILIGKWLLSPIDIDEVKRKGIDIIQSGAFPPN